jgi:hypothetical protein
MSKKVCRNCGSKENLKFTFAGWWYCSDTCFKEVIKKSLDKSIDDVTKDTNKEE